MEKEIIAVDIETNGLNYGQEMTLRDIELSKNVGASPNVISEIIEVVYLSENEHSHKFIKDTAINKETLSLSGIKEEDLINGEELEIVMKDLYRATRNKTILTYNAPFIMGFIKYYGNKYGLNFDNEVIDILEIDRKYRKEGRHTTNEMVSVYGIDPDSLKYKNNRLGGHGNYSFNL